MPFGFEYKHRKKLVNRIGTAATRTVRLFGV